MRPSCMAPQVDGDGPEQDAPDDHSDPWQAPALHIPRGKASETDRGDEDKDEPGPEPERQGLLLCHEHADILPDEGQASSR